MRLKTDAELEYERKYGGKTDTEMNNIVGGMLSKKFADARARAEQVRTEQDDKYNLPYGGLVKAVAKTGKQVKDLEGKPENLISAKRKDLEAEYADLVMRGMPDTNKELWISEELVKYMQEPDGAYREAKSQLQRARNALAIFLAKKEEWEQENADIIEAERMRTKRAELLQADPDALRALGIEPVARGEKATPQKEETAEEKALKAMEVDTDAMLHSFMVNRGYTTAEG